MFIVYIIDMQKMLRLFLEKNTSQITELNNSHTINYNELISSRSELFSSPRQVQKRES